MIKSNPPGLFITGHSHILKVMPDKSLNNLLHLNPGAAGKHGFHTVRTMMRFNVEAGKVNDLQVIELGKRA
jgi:predicted phosphodiesterase